MADATLGLEGKDALLDALARLPETLQRKILRKWTKAQADKVVARAKALAPHKTGKLRAGIVARNSSAATLRKKGSLARSVAIGKKPAFHFHIVNLGTKQRATKRPLPGRTAGRAALMRRKLKGTGHANRGRMPANPFLADAARPVIAEALASAGSSLAAEVERALAAALKRTLKRGKG